MKTQLVSLIMPFLASGALLFVNAHLSAQPPLSDPLLPSPEITPVPPSEESTDPPTTPATPEPDRVAEVWPDAPVTADALPPGLRADDLIGQRVVGKEREQLGTLRDLVIDVEKGEVEYAVVESGGFLGLGQTRRLVPAAAITSSVPAETDDRPADARPAPAVPLDREAWEQAPAFKGNPLEALADRDHRQQLNRHYQETADTAAAASEDDAHPLERWRLARDLRGADVRSGDVTIGTVEAILVDLDHLGALVQLSPRVAALGTSRGFIVRFDQLSSGPGNTLSTSLSPEDFRKVLPELTGALPDRS